MPQASTPLVAVTADFRITDRPTHLVYDQYLRPLAEFSGCQPVIVPALGRLSDIGAVLDCVAGVLLTGSASNVHPARYGADPDPEAEPYDPDRDETSFPLIAATLERRLPLFAICRGLQELNVMLGGTLHTAVHNLPGRMDHRAPADAGLDQRFALRHPVRLRQDGPVADIVGADTIMVNSVHRQGIDRLAAGLRVEGEAEDGTVEAVSLHDRPAFAIGVQWHPEFLARTDAPSRHLFAAFGEAVRDG
ncbi:MAG: gamma-glutamyl-gamma-aminobutyrate hydrolase family protein [Alphaproteobacteria bacterium]